MSVISVEITEASEQIIAGIPRSVVISTNIPATIFYTTDGTEPDTMSSVYVSAIVFPTNVTGITLKVFATNGIDNSAIIEQTYGPPDWKNQRTPRSKISGLTSSYAGLGPFGSGTALDTSIRYEGSDDAGITVLKPLEPTFESGYFGEDGYAAALTNKPLEEYKILASETDRLGQTGPGVGTRVSVKYVSPTNEVPIDSKKSSKLFNPKALVIYQDLENDAESVVHLNRQEFTLSRPGFERDGLLRQNVWPVTGFSTGSFIRAETNPRDNTITYYYYDNNVNRWIISKQPHVLKDPNINNLAAGVVFGREGRGVFRWRPFMRRILG